MNNKLTDFSEVDEVFSTTSKDLSFRGHGNKFYHNLESLVKCPRCGDCGRFQRWIGQREFDRKIGKQGGRDNA